MKKFLKIIFITLALLIVALILLVLFWLGPAAKVLVEGIGPKALGTPVTIKSLSINPRKGTLNLRGFQIGIQEGFSRTNTWDLAELHVSIDMRSLFSDTLVIHEILINSPHFTYEKNQSSDNISEFIQNILAFARVDPNQPKKKNPKKEKPTEKKSKQVVIEWLKIQDLRMSLANTDQSELDLQFGVEEIALCLTNGMIQLNHIFLGSSERLASPNVTEIESITVQLDANSLYSDTLIIKDIQISKPYAYFEQNHNTDTLAEFMQIINSFSATTPHTPSPALPSAENTAPTPTSTRTAAPVELQNLAIHDFQFHLLNQVDPQLSLRLRLAELAITPPQGTVLLNHLTLSNPQRLATPNLFELESIKVQLDPTALASGAVVIEDVQVHKPYAFLEKNRQTDTVSEIMKIIQRFAHKNSTPPRPTALQVQAPKDQPTPTERAPLQLHQLHIEDLQLKYLDSTPTHAPVATRTFAAIDHISIQLQDGSVQVGAITIPNPPTFTANPLFHLDHIQVSIDPDSLFSDQIVVHKVWIGSPKIHLEQTKNSGNLSELMQALADFKPVSTSPPIAVRPQPKAAALPLAEQPLIIHTVWVTNFTAHLSAPLATNSPPTGLIPSLGIREKIRLKERLQLDHLPYNKEPTETPPTTSSFDLLAFDLLSIEPLKGMVKVNQLQVGNPPGFASPHLMKIKSYRMDFSPSSIQSDTVIIEDILIQEPQVAYERKLTTDNIKALQELIESIVQRRASYTSEPPQPTAPERMGPPLEGETLAALPAPSGKKVVIEHLEFNKGIIRAKISKLPAIPIIPLHFELNNLGQKQGGTSIQQAFGDITAAFYDAIIGAVGNTTGVATDALKNVSALTFDTLGGWTGHLGGFINQDDGDEAVAAESENSTVHPPAESPKKKNQ